ncbi:MAG: (2Fe-2S)-binding protein [Aeromicrobium sp.]|uniref:(2Fe-2S)-binding protein n=1 Tax=Aeromicrobium sp. TaxID=1871063 RepID=UPI0039E611F7
MGVDELGPFFAVEEVGGEGWRTLDELVHGTGLAERVDFTRRALAERARVEVEERVAASTASLGIFARLLSPVIGAALLEVPAPSDPRWQAGEAGPLRLAATTRADPEVVGLIDTTLAPLVDRLAADHGVSATIGWGNAVSAVHGACRMAAQAAPTLRPRAADLLADLLRHPRLADTADLGPPLVRRSCCLYYRLPGGGYCGDCVLAHR